jgi:GTP-binding protein
VSELPGTTRDAVDIMYERGGQHFLLIDTAGMRARSKHSSSVEVFSVMRAERTIRRADLCILVLDLTSGVTGQDKKIAGLIQKAKNLVCHLDKWDLVKPNARQSSDGADRSETREDLCFSTTRRSDRLRSDGRERRTPLSPDRGCPPGGGVRLGLVC